MISSAYVQCFRKFSSGYIDPGSNGPVQLGAGPKTLLGLRREFPVVEGARATWRVFRQDSRGPVFQDSGFADQHFCVKHSPKNALHVFVLFFLSLEGAQDCFYCFDAWFLNNG